MDVYRGADKVAEFENYNELRLGENKPAFIYEGNELVYPNPVKDGLILWYDFSAMSNNDAQRDVAEDLSGNGNHGTLQNFNFTAESGYDKTGLSFDGVDDYVGSAPLTKNIAIKSYEVTFSLESAPGIWGGIFGDYNHSSSHRSGANISYYASGSIRQIRVVYTDANNNQKIISHNADLNKAIHVTLVFTADSEELYVNGEFVSSRNYGVSEKNENSVGLTLGVWEIYKSYIISGEIFSSRAYNRPLTPEEIAHNYAIEKERFGIE